MVSKIFLTLSAATMGIGLANSPLRNYPFFNLIMDFLGSGGAVKGIRIDCSPPKIKYPVLCASLFTSGASCVVTSDNPLAISCFRNTGRLIIEAIFSNKLTNLKFSDLNLKISLRRLSLP